MSTLPTHAHSSAASKSPTYPEVPQLELDNGLQVVWEEDHRQPLVAIEVRIKGGLRGEGKWLGSGITHFIEHMLFKGTPSRAPGTIDQEVRRYGGTINAFTALDTTGVDLFVESKHLKEALGMLADILQNAVFDPAEFEKERAVILSEIQMNQDDPDRRLHQLFWSKHFLEHPYRHPILGYPSLLEQLTVKDMADLYAREYQPQNVTIALAGDLQAATLPALIKEIFSGWKRGAGDPFLQGVASEPPAATAKKTAMAMPVQSAYVLLGFSSVRLSDPDLYALDVLASILGRGRSSRLYEGLLRGQKLVHAVSSWNYTPYDPGIFGIQLRADADKARQAIDAAVGILEQIRQKGVTQQELAKAKRQVSADYLFGLQTVEGRAADLANSLATTGDPLFSRRYVEQIKQITAEAVKWAAIRYCTPATMTTAVIMPAASASEKGAAQQPVFGIQTSKTVLDNGATVILGLDQTLPIAGLVVAFHGGVRVEGEQTQGLSNLAAQLLTKGTRKKSASEIAETVESLGGSLEPFSGRDGFGVVLQVLAEDLSKGLDLVHELVTESVFDSQEVAIQRELIVKQLQADEDEIFEVGGRLLRSKLFGRHPYRFHPLGIRATVSSFDSPQCRQFAQQWLVPSNMVISVFGSIDEQAVLAEIRKGFGSLAKKPTPWPARMEEPALSEPIEASAVMDREQALVMLGFRGITTTATDREAVEVMTAVLSGMSGRLFQSVREKHGLSYTLGAVNVPGWDPGYLLVYAATKPQERDKVLQVLDEQLGLAASEGFNQEEVDQAKRFLIGQHRMDLQHVVGLARQAALDELYGVGFDAWKGYEQRVSAVDVPMVNEAARRYLNLKQRARILVSPANGRVTLER